MEEENIERKKYWLKLDKDFLKNPQMKVLKNMPNGKDYIIFYLSLMLESVETVGHLRFTSLVPYNDEMLSAVTDTNIDVVRSAIKIFCELGLMQIFDDGTIFMPSVPKMTGKECESAERVRKYRKKLKESDIKMLQCNDDVTKCNDNKEEDKEEDIIKRKRRTKRFVPPSLEEVEEYCKERNNNVDPEKFKNYYDALGWTLGRNKAIKDWKACVRTWERNSYNSPQTRLQGKEVEFGVYQF